MERINILMPNNFPKFLMKTSQNFFDGGRRFLKINFQSVNSYFPEVDIYKFRLKEKFIRQQVKSYQKILLDELLIESGMDESVLSLPYLKKRRFIFMDINILKERDIIPKEIDVCEQLLSKLELFPYDSKPKTSYIRKKITYQTIKELRDSIEKQFIAWKLKTNLSIIKKLFLVYTECFVVGRSLNSVQKNINLILSMPKAQNLNVANKLYLLSMKPFESDSIENFEDNLVGLPWHEVARLSPRIISRPYNSLILFVEALRDKNFTDNQIQIGLPFFRCSLPFLVCRLNFILLSQEFSVFKNDDHFLSLLCLSVKSLEYLAQKKFKSFSEYFKYTMEIDLKLRKLNSTELYILIDNYLDITPLDFCMLYRYNMCKKINPKVIIETIKFLKTEFTTEEIIESINVILYPKELIEKWLQNIRSNPRSLVEAGFDKGHVPQPTNIFNCGTKLQNKTLQLCLYFLDKYQNVMSYDNYKLEDCVY